MGGAAVDQSLADSSAAVETAANRLLPLLQTLGREDLTQRVTAAVARVKRPSTVVCVVGEFKQGKSSLVNGLLGQPVCPIDDDLATAAITLVRYADQPSAVVRRRVDDKPVAEQVAIEDIAAWVSESGNPANAKRVERVDVALPSPLLNQGLALVDTPGMGGLGAGHAAATLAFLPFADGLLFLSDASAELSAPEVEFLQRANELCPTVLVVQTKIDLYPAWRRIAELNRGHLAQRAIDLPMVSVSNTLRAEALGRKDRDLNERSGYPALLAALADQVIAPAKDSAADRSATDVSTAVGLVRSIAETEKAVLEDPASASEALERFEHAKERLEHLRGPGARWNLVVADHVGDLSNDVNYRLRHTMRAINRQVDGFIEEIKTPKAWDELARDLQTDVANAVTDAFVAIEQGRASIREEIIELLGEEDLDLPASGSAASEVNLMDLWEGKALDPKSNVAGRAFKAGLSGVRGAQGGVMMFGMMGQFLPTASAVVLASNPVLLGAGAIFGGMQMFDERKRKITARRQAARMQLRQFIDDVQFEVGNEISNAVRGLQRELRDDFGSRLTELQRTYADAAQQAQQAAKQDQEQSRVRLQEVGEILGGLDAIEAALPVRAAVS